MQRIKTFRFAFRSSCSCTSLPELYARRAQLDQAIRALERVQRMRERRTCRRADYDSALDFLRADQILR